jgi:hypothetical protein
MESRKQGEQMNNARVERMLRELDCDPSHQFFGLIGLGKTLARPALATVSLSLVGSAHAR